MSESINLSGDFSIEIGLKKDGAPYINNVPVPEIPNDGKWHHVITRKHSKNAPITHKVDGKEVAK